MRAHGRPLPRRPRAPLTDGQPCRRSRTRVSPATPTPTKAPRGRPLTPVRGSSRRLRYACCSWTRSRTMGTTRRRRAARACIIGAGSSGIAAAKALHERGIPFDCFEKSDRVGGNWVFANKNGMSAAYRDLFINTSRPRMEYTDYPMPESYPDFPHHTHIAAYFDNYVDHFGFREKITFETGRRARLARRERRLERASSTPARRAATTRCSSPTGTTGTRAGPNRRSRARTASPASSCTPTPTATTRSSPASGSWSLGMGNSAMDIAVESSYVAERTYLAARQGVWIVPKYIFGKPVDQMRNDPRVPFKIRQRMIQALIRGYAGPPERYGLPKPNHRFGEAHPTVSGRILDRIQHGTITPKPNIDSFDGAHGAASSTAAPSTPTSSSTAPATRSPSPSSTRTSSRRPTTASSCSGASFTPMSRTCSSSACCSRSARSCRSPRRRAPGSATTCSATTRCPTAARMRADIQSRPGGDARTLRRLQAPHDPGRLRRLPPRARQGAPRGRRAGPRERLPPTGAMPTFCRHNRFIERCPICSKTLPGYAAERDVRPPLRTRPPGRALARGRAAGEATGARGRGDARPPRGSRRAGRLQL